MECIEVKIYTKKELALLYFPDSMPETATKHLMRWVRRNKPLIQELDATNYKRQLLKIPRSKKCYYEIKELLRALTLSMLLSLEIANA